VVCHIFHTFSASASSSSCSLLSLAFFFGGVGVV
jgi:hypothetical protein